MRISWIVPGFQSDTSDYCIPALTDLAHQLAERHSLTVYALQYPHRRDCYTVGRVQIRSFGLTGPAKFQKLWRAGSLLAALRAIQRQPADLIHAFWAAQPALVGVVAAKLTRRKLIVSCMGGEAVYLPEIGYGAANRRLDRFYFELAERGVDRLTCGSSTLAEILKSRFPNRVEPVVLPLGVDLARFVPVSGLTTKSLPERPLMLAVGSLLPVKGHANLIRAVAEIPEVRLRIVGEGPERPRLERLIVDLDLRERVELIGHVAPEEMPAEYSRADCLVLSSYYESQCVALLEGMAAGLPVVASPVGLAPQLLGDSRAGELAADNSPVAISQAIQKLLLRRQEWARLREAADTAAHEYSLEKCSQNFLKLYESILCSGQVMRENEANPV